MLSKAYLLGGHGNETEPSFIVPKDCIIITPVEMGKFSTEAEVRKNITNLCHLSPTTVVNPLTNTNDLIRAFGPISIFKEGDRCPGFKYTLLGCGYNNTCTWEHGKDGFIYTETCPDIKTCYNNFSGVIDLSSDECRDPRVFNEISLYRMLESKHVPINDLFEPHIVSFFGFLYTNSIYPTAEEIRSTLSQWTLVNFLDDYDEYIESAIFQRLITEGVVDRGGRKIGPGIVISDEELVAMGVAVTDIQVFKAFDLLKDTNATYGPDLVEMMIKLAHKSLILGNKASRAERRNTISVTQEKLCSMFPGVYYNFICRSKGLISKDIYTIGTDVKLNYNKINLSGPGLLRKNNLHKMLRERVGEAELSRKPYIKKFYTNQQKSWRCPVCGYMNQSGIQCLACGMPKTGGRRKTQKRKKTRSKKH